MKTETIDIALIKVTKKNPRIIDKKSDRFQKLLTSVIAVGVQIPIHVKEFDGTAYELLAGERRLQAAKMAKHIQIPVLIHEKDEAAGITHIENFARQDLSLFERLRGVSLLMEENTDINWLADQLAISVSEATQIVHIHKNLLKAWAKLLKDEQGGWEGWTIKMIALIARQPASAQEESAESYSRGYTRSHTTYDCLKRHFENNYLKLNTFPWDLDKQFPGVVFAVTEGGQEYPAGMACETCKTKTDKTNELFPEFAEDKIESCLNSACYAAKYSSCIKNTYENQVSDHKGLVGYLPNKMYRLPNGVVVPDDMHILVEGYTCARVKKGVKGAIPAVKLSGKQFGHIIWLTKSRASASGVPKNETKKPASEKTYKEKMAELTMKRHCGTNVVVCDKLLKLALSETGLNSEQVYRLVLRLGIPGECLSLSVKYLKELMASTDPSGTVLADLWAHAASQIDADIRYNGTFAGYSVRHKQLTLTVCTLLQMDYETLFKEVSESKGFTIPKSWKKDK